MIEKTSLEKDLGIWFSNTMKPADHVTHAVNKANQILGLIRRSFVHLDQLLMKQRFYSSGKKITRGVLECHLASSPP